MHEASIALNILRITKDELIKNGGSNVETVKVEIGALSGVELESLQFALNACKDQDVFKSTNFLIEEIEAKAKCRVCGNEFEAGDFFEVCPKCSSFELDYLSGKELKIKSIEIV